MKKFTKAFLAAALLLSTNATDTFAQALNFGSYSYVVLNDILANDQSYTKEAWIRISYYQPNHGCNIISAWDHPFWLENGVLSASNGYGNIGHTNVEDNVQIELNKWVHVAVTYDAASSTMKLYKNGALVATNTNAPSYITSGLQIGAQEYGDFFDGGDIDEVRVWDVARTQAEIKAAMNCDVPQSSSLVAYYRFDQGTIGADNTSLGSIYDYSSNANCGTMTNFNLTGSTENYITGAIGTCNPISIITNAPAAIAGASSLCEGAAITLSNSVGGGVWGVDDIDTASISDAGVLTGGFGGTVNVTYKTCGGSVSKKITVNPAPVISATASNGSIVASALEGTAPYTYAWSNGKTGSTLTSLLTGTYQATVTDAKGCKDTGSYYVTGSVILTNSISIKACNNVYTGGEKHVIYIGYGPQSVTLTANATGASSFSYSWTPGTYLSNTWSKSVTFTPKKEGIYTYTCKATTNGKSVYATVTMVVIDVVDRKRKDCIYTTHCSPRNKGRKDTKSVKCKDVPKHLSCNKSDRLGAYGSRKTIENNPGDTKGILVVAPDMVVTSYPNPFTDGINIKVDGNEAETAEVAVYDMAGRMVEYKQNQAVNTKIVVGNNLATGMYILNVKKGEEIKTLKVVKSK